MVDRPGPPRFRPRGFSPPRRFPGSARACGFVAPRCRPWAVSPFRAFPSRQVAHPSSGSLAPLPFVPVEPRCGARGLVTSGLHRLGRRSGVVPGRILPEARGSLSASLLAPSTTTLRRRQKTRLAAPPGHPGPRTPDPPRSGRSVDFGAFFPARVRSHHATVTRRAEAGALLGVLAPPEPCSRQAWGPHSPATAGGVPPPAGTARLSARRATPWIPVLRALLVACAASAPLLGTLDVRWNRAEMTESSRATRRRTPDRS